MLNGSDKTRPIRVGSGRIPAGRVHFAIPKFIAQFLSPQIRPANPSSKYKDNVFYICTFSGLILKINNKKIIMVECSI